MMSWSINQVAKISRVTSRTLRHYHAIGLLEPESTDFGGRRHYGQRELLRLQEILLLRRLGLGLKEIARILDSGASREDALRGHLAALAEERDRLDLLIQTVERTIEEGPSMTPDEIFEGLHNNPYEEEARERWGDDAVDASKEKLQRLTPAEIERVSTGFDRVHRRLEELHAEAVPVGDPSVRELIAEHYEIVSLTWTPTPEVYIGLGRLYVEDERFRESIGRGNDAMVEYLRDAIAENAGEVSRPEPPAA